MLPPVTRRRHQNSRKGCARCKALHVKCSEALPRCLRCTKANAACVYPVPDSSQVRGFKIATTGGFLNNPDGDDGSVEHPLKHNFTPEEAVAWSFYHEHSVPLLEATAASFWSTRLPSMALSVTSIKYFVLAIGSLHASLDAVSTVSERLSHVYLQKAISSFNSSVEALADHKSRLAVALGVCLSFTLLKGLQSESAEHMRHLKHGLSMAVDAMRADTDNFHSLYVFSRLSYIALENALLSTEGSQLDSPNQPTLLDIPLNVSMAPAEASAVQLNNIVNGVFRLGKDMYSAKLDAFGKRSIKATLKRQIEQWQVQLERFKKRDMVGSLEHALLTVRCELALVVLEGSVDGHQIAYDAFTKSYEMMTCTIERALDMLVAKYGHAIDKHAFSFDLGLLLTIYYIIRVCRDPPLRRRLLGLVKRCPKREDLWRREEVYTASKAVIEFEEDRSLEEATDCVIPEERRCHLVRYSRTSAQELDIVWLLRTHSEAPFSTTMKRVRIVKDSDIY